MAAINSHRKRQVYDPNIQRSTSGYYSTTQAPAGASTMMPSKAAKADSYYSYNRQFNDLWNTLTRKYFAFAFSRVREDRFKIGGDRNTYVEVLNTSPAGMVNYYNNNGYVPIRPRMGSQPTIYQADITAAGGYISSSRKSTGLLIGSYASYKKVQGKGYQYVIDVGGHLRGNIKSRQQALKWIGGMWREKK